MNTGIAIGQELPVVEYGVFAVRGNRGEVLPLCPALVGVPCVSVDYTHPSGQTIVTLKGGVRLYVYKGHVSIRVPGCGLYSAWEGWVSRLSYADLCL